MSKRSKFEGPTICHGAKIRIYPNSAQAAQFDDWRRKCRKLWNLLLAIEQAAYSGEKYAPQIRWRQKWLAVVEETFAKLDAAHRAGKTTRAGKPILAPKPITDEFRRKTRGGKKHGIPGLFLWEDELLKVMARLKKEPLTSWIADIQSHAAQAVCSDLIRAIKAMLRERRKRAAGQGGRNTGFPRFKKTSAYAAGSVYIEYTQMAFDHNARTIKFSNGVGKMPYGNKDHIPDNATVICGRVFREGEKWWLSAQFEFEAPKALPVAGRECGLKIAASTVYTVVDSANFVRQVQTPREPARHAFQMKLASKSLSRRGKAHQRRTKSYYKQAAKMAYMHARNRNVRDDVLHKASRAIVNDYDAISVQAMNVRELMQKDPAQKGGRSLRKLNRRAAMARARVLVTYKATEGGRLLNETPALIPIVQECSRCGTLNYMPLAKRVMNCYTCGNKLERSPNAALNELEQLQIVKAADAVL